MRNLQTILSIRLCQTEEMTADFTGWYAVPVVRIGAISSRCLGVAVAQLLSG
jgi:hypothetical protein